MPVTIPKIAEAAACALGLGPCDARPTQYEAARLEAVRACERVVTGAETSWTSELCEAASDPLDTMVASFVDLLMDQRPGGLSRDYIMGFAERHGVNLRAVVASLR